MLQEIIGDHVVEYDENFDFRNNILRLIQITRVVKVGVAYETEQLIFEEFYVCFHDIKESFFGGSRRLIDLDNYFLKSVYKDQLLMAVCRDENNQMLPIAWVVVEVGN